MEEEYDFDLVLRYRVRWHFSDNDGNSCQGEYCYFVTQIWFWAYIRPEGPRYDFCEKKKLRKKIRVYSLQAELCNSSQIQKKTFSSARGFFPQGFPCKSCVFLYFFISLLCH